jgi:hypothetical protein
MKTSLRLTIAAFGLALFNLSTATVHAGDYTYTTNNGTITITGYRGMACRSSALGTMRSMTPPA